jgi:DNA-directed RNA polymerase specialized sigma24 family protein
MSADGSVTTWLGLLRAGNAAAAQELWQRYYTRLVAVSRERLRGTSRRAADEEDVALSAFHSFCQAAANNRFPQLGSRHDLWQVLLMLTARKAYQERLRQSALKRGGRPDTAGEGGRFCAAFEDCNLEEVLGSEPSPELTVMLAEEFEHLLTRLPNDALRQLARLRLEEYTNAEIAARLGCTERTVQRKLALIRGYWEETVVE